MLSDFSTEVMELPWQPNLGQNKAKLQEISLLYKIYDQATRASLSSHGLGQVTVTAACLSVTNCVEQSAVRFAVYRHLAEHFQEQTENISV